MQLSQKVSQMWSKMFLELWNHTFAVDPAWFWNDWIKTVANANLSYNILYHFFKISKIYQTFMRPSKQARALMFIYYRRAPHDFSNWFWSNWMKIVGGEAFITYHILYHYFKIRKFKNSLIGQKAQASQILYLILTIYYTINSKYQKFAKNSKLVWSSKMHKLGEWCHTWCLYAIGKLSD